MIKYIGSKRVLVPVIVQLLAGLERVRTAADLFTGTTRVAQALKRVGVHVVANDVASYSLQMSRCYIEADVRELDVARLHRLLAQLDQLPGRDGFFTRTYCLESRFFQPQNGRRIDAIRPAIDDLARDELERAVLLTSLLLAADRVDSTTGVQMAYLKQWAPRSHKPLEMRLPELLPGGGRATHADANELACSLEPVDLAYIDPPYNHHSYRSNYHLWETLVHADEPDTYGVARKRSDCRTMRSRYNSKRTAGAALADLLTTIRARNVLVSFSDEAFADRDDVLQLLATRWDEVAVLPVGHPRYVGARIGIHNPAGQRVGQVSHLRNTEYLFLAGPRARAAVDATAAWLESQPARRVTSAAAGAPDR